MLSSHFTGTCRGILFCFLPHRYSEVSNMEGLPEEILKRVIEYALPLSASVMRNGRCVGGHQPLFNVSKQFYRIAQSIFYSRPLLHYITHAYDACDAQFQRSLWLTSVWPPWEQFSKIKIHFHPEISFLTLNRHEKDVLRQMDHYSLPGRSRGIWGEACQLARFMHLAGLPQLVRDRKLDIKIKFHDTCPFHDRITHADTENTPPHHIPLWDRDHVQQISREFQWLVDPIESLLELRQLVTFPHIACAAPYSKGHFDNMQLGADFIFNLTLLNMWAGAGEGGKAIASQADRTFSDDQGYNSSLKGFVDSFDAPGYSSYSINPGGDVHQLKPNNVRNMKYFQGVWHMHMYKWNWGTYKWDHDFNVVETVLMELKEQLDDIVDGLPRSQSHGRRAMVLHARTEAFSEIFAAISREWDSWHGVQGRDTPVRDDTKTRKGVRAQLKRLKSLGLWDGKWEDLNNASCHVVKADADLGRFWCKCGKEINLDVREVVSWKARNGIGHEELLKQMKGTPFALDLIQELGMGSWTKSGSSSKR